MNYRAAALRHSPACILGVGMNAHLWRRFDERKITRGFFLKGRDKLEINVSKSFRECGYAKLWISYSLRRDV